MGGMGLAGKAYPAVAMSSSWKRRGLSSTGPHSRGVERADDTRPAHSLESSSSVVRRSPLGAEKKR